MTGVDGAVGVGDWVVDVEATVEVVGVVVEPVCGTTSTISSVIETMKAWLVGLL